MNPSFKTLLFLLLLPLLPACRSDESVSAPPVEPGVVHHTGEECICGSPEGDLVGCHCEECLMHGGNPFNPDCTCLPIRPQEDLHLTYASFSAGSTGRPSVGGSLVGLDEIKLRRGGRIKGTVTADDGETISFRLEGGQVETYGYDELDHRMVYRLLKARTDKQDGEAELRLANYARDCGLYAHSRRHYGNALDADPELADQVESGLHELRVKASQSELDMAREAFEAGRESEARKHLETVLKEFPDEEAAGTASAMLREMTLQGLSAEQRELVAGLSAEAMDELGPASSAYEKAVAKNQEGLTSTSSPSRAIQSYKAALREGERARAALERAASRSLEDQALRTSVASYQKVIVGLLVEVHTNMASAYLMDSDYDRALASVNEALVLDSANEAALQLRARIESARNDYQEGYRSGYSRGRDEDTIYPIGGGWIYGYRRGIGHRPAVPGRMGYGGWGGGRGGGIRLR